MKVSNRNHVILSFDRLESGDCFIDMTLDVVVMKLSTMVSSIDCVEVANAVILKTGELMFYDKDETVIALPEAELTY